MLWGQLLTSKHFLYATSHLISVFTATDTNTRGLLPNTNLPVDKRQGKARQGKARQGKARQGKKLFQCLIRHHGMNKCSGEETNKGQLQSKAVLISSYLQV